VKKIILASAVVLGTALVSASPAFAAPGNTSTAAGSATATVVSPIVLTHTSGAALAFGSFTTGTGGTVVVTSAGSGSATGDVVFVPGNANTADAFTITGDFSRAYGITTTGGTVSNGTDTMAFTTAASAASGTLSATGTGGFSVGGTLTVAGTETAGAYTGSYNATVTYN